MSKLRLWITMSIDGFVAGPAQDADNPLGVGGMHLHAWVVPLAAWRQTQGFTGGEVNDSSPVIEASMRHDLHLRHRRHRLSPGPGAAGCGGRGRLSRRRGTDSPAVP